MRIRGKAPVKAPLLLWDLHSSSRDEWELDWRKRDGRAFLAMRLSWTKAQSHSRVSWLCSGTRSRSIFLGQECWGAWGSLLEKVDRDKMLEGPWPKQRHLCLSWNVTGNYRRFLGSLTILSPLRKMMGWTLTLDLQRRSCYFPYQQKRLYFESLFFFCQNKSFSLSYNPKR